MSSNGFNRGMVVFSEARSAVNQLLGSKTDPLRFTLTAARINLQLWRAKEEVVGALAELLRHPDMRRRVLAAWTLWASPGRVAGRIHSDLITESERILIDALESHLADERRFAVSVVMEETAPESCVPALCRLLTSEDLHAQVFAAVSLARMGKSDDRLLAVLRMAVELRSPILSAVAARGLLILGIKPAACHTALASALDRSSSVEIGTVLFAVANTKPLGTTVQTMLVRIVEDRKRHPDVRGMAASILGNADTNRNVSVPVLHRALNSRAPALLCGALRGIAGAGKHPADWSRLCRLLNFKHEDVRLTAAVTLEAAGAAAAALPYIIKRLGNEESIAENEALARVIAAIGPSAVSEIIPVVRQQQIRKLPTIAMAMRKMGPESICAFANALSQEADEFAFTTLVTFVRDLGAAAAPVLPVLSRLLESANEELALLLVSAIFATGQNGFVAAPALLKRLPTAGEELASAIERTLWFMGPEVIPLVGSELSVAGEKSRHRLSRVLAGIGSEDDARFYRCRKLGSDEDIEFFICAVEAVASGAHPSSHGIADAFKTREEFRKFSPSLPTSQTAVLKVLNRVESCLGINLRTGAKRGRGVLTDEAKDVYREARKYHGIRMSKRGEWMTS